MRIHVDIYLYTKRVVDFRVMYIAHIDVSSACMKLLLSAVFISFCG